MRSQFCSSCGEMLEPNATTCPKCGRSVPERRPEEIQPLTNLQSNPLSSSQSLPSAYWPISAWGYFGYALLFAIPIVGLIFLLVFSLGGTQNENLKNFARSYFCSLAVAVPLLILCFIIGGAEFFENFSYLF